MSGILRSLRKMNKTKGIFLLILIILGLSLYGLISMLYRPQVQPLAVSSKKLWVDGFDNVRTGWIRIGSSPYLDAQDQPTNMVNSTTSGDLIGDFSFANMPSGAVSLINVSLYFYGYSYYALERSKIYLWNGSWQYIGYKSGAWGWKSFDVTNVLDTFSEIDGAKIYLERYGAYGYEVAADACYLEVYFEAPTLPSGLKGDEKDGYGYCTNTTYLDARNHSKAIKIISDTYQGVRRTSMLLHQPDMKYF